MEPYLYVIRSMVVTEKESGIKKGSNGDSNTAYDELPYFIVKQVLLHAWHMDALALSNVQSSGSGGWSSISQTPISSWFPLSSDMKHIRAGIAPGVLMRVFRSKGVCLDKPRGITNDIHWRILIAGFFSVVVVVEEAFLSVGSVAQQRRTPRMKNKPGCPLFGSKGLNSDPRWIEEPRIKE
jgi:hypothetical protein